MGNENARLVRANEGIRSKATEDVDEGSARGLAPAGDRLARLRG
jgi:hypothetical protein